VVRPSDVEDVSFIVEAANRYGVPVIPRGSGTSLVAGPLPIEGGIVVDMQMMNGILDRDDFSGLIRVEAGVKVLELNKVFPDRFMPINPDGSGFSTVGGLIAEDAASPLSAKYGTMKDLVIGVEVVLPSGEVVLVEQPGPPSKWNTLGLMLGSEGTLGIFTSAYLRLPLKPESRRAFIIEFSDVSDSITVQNTIEKEGMSVMGFEVYHNYREVVEGGGTEAIAYLELAGKEDCVDLWSSRLSEVLGSMEIQHEEADLEDASDIWIRRKGIYEIAKSRKSAIKVVSMRVHPHLVRDAVQEIDRTGSRMKLPVVTVFDPPLGWVMAIFLYDPTNEKEVERTEKAAQNVIGRTVSLGGSVGFGTGIGVNRITPDMDEGFVTIFSKVKEALDPNWIMNPGKLIER
ncbi:MAG: FAD-binding oxidoreductase, partial [Candidatus Korarchaeota archaeon]|nr:FAD-binding oxidoreductase [Candidatus Korarchaeota archaeon]